MLVLKFGGTSVGSAERLKNLVGLIRREDSVVVVLSAMSGITNILEQISKRSSVSEALALLNNVEKKFSETALSLLINGSVEVALENIKTRISIIKDEINSEIINEKLVLAQGEYLTTELFSQFLQNIGVENQLLDATTFMHLDSCNEPNEHSIQNLLGDQMQVTKKLFITQGFIAQNSKGEIDNLKRGGSDYSASLIGEALNASAIEIWTDIDGFHNNDPRFVEETQTIEYMSFEEAAELAYFGAKILHPTCIIPAKRKEIPVCLKDTMNPRAVGTLISNNYLTPGIKAVAAKDGITTIRITSGRMLQAHGFLKNVFEVFDNNKTPIDVITTSEVAVSLTIDNTTNLDVIVKKLMEFGKVEVRSNCSIVSIVGHEIATTPNALTSIYESFKDIKTHMISFGGSNNNITFVINTVNKVQSLQALNNNLFKNTEHA